MSSNSIMVIIFYFDGVHIGYQRLKLNSLSPSPPLTRPAPCPPEKESTFER
jgi:FAD synthase